MIAQDKLEGKKILIVDDEPDVVETLEDLLPMCSVATAANFVEAKTLLETEYFDLAILDIMGVDGYRLLEIANHRRVTAVMLTAHALSPGNVKHSYKKGAAFYIPKEKMIDIVQYLNDILADIEKGKNPWDRWFEKLGTFCERQFGSDWKKSDQDFWERFPFY